MRDLVPWPGVEPRPPALGTQNLNHWTTREVPSLSGPLKKNFAYTYFKGTAWKLNRWFPFPQLSYMVRENSKGGWKMYSLAVEPGLNKNSITRTSLVVQWLRIHLPMQGTWVWALVWEDPTCCGATKPMRHNLSLRSRACKPQLLRPCATTPEAWAPRARALQQEKPPQWEPCAPQGRVAPAHSN